MKNKWYISESFINIDELYTWLVSIQSISICYTERVSTINYVPVIQFS